MAKKKKMAKQKWTTQHNYKVNKADKVTWDQKRADPEKYGLTEEAVALKTVPGQSVSIKELMDRYEKGRPIPQE